MVGRTPLFLAAKHGNTEAVSSLIAKKSNPFARTRAGNSIDSVAQLSRIKTIVFKRKAGFWAKKFELENPKKYDEDTESDLG